MKVTFAIELDLDQLSNLDDANLAATWHAVQLNPAPADDRDAGDLADAVGREIIRRWLAAAPVLMHEHRVEHHYWMTLHKHGEWTGPGQTWQPRQSVVPDGCFGLEAAYGR